MKHFILYFFPLFINPLFGGLPASADELTLRMGDAETTISLERELLTARAADLPTTMASLLDIDGPVTTGSAVWLVPVYEEIETTDTAYTLMADGMTTSGELVVRTVPQIVQIVERRMTGQLTLTLRPGFIRDAQTLEFYRLRPPAQNE